MTTDHEPVVPCRNNPALWESERPEDHLEAKRSCDTICTIKATCQALFELTVKDYGLQHGPRGTWAGNHYVEPRTDRRKSADEVAA